MIVTASNDSLIDATNLVAMASGSQSVAILLAFNTVGWGRSNLLFAAVDALLGDPLISSRAVRRRRSIRPRRSRR